MADRRADLSDMFGGPRVVVSSIQTQASGGDGGGRMTRFDPRLFGVVVVDEGHHGVSASYRKVLNWYTQHDAVRVLGVTATPDRADEEALGQVYESVAYDYEISDAIHDGWLVPVRQQVVHVEGLDFSQCRTTGGDLNGGDLARVMEYEENLQRVVAPSVEIIGDRRTLVFAASVAHAERMAEMFNRHRAGMAAWVCGKTDKDERKRILGDFKSGAVQVVVNCAVLTEGFDNPAVEIVVMARPTKSRSLYAQMAGRALRPAECIAHDLGDHESPDARRALIEASEKPSALLVDYVGNSGEHKLCTSADILGGKVSERASELASSIMQRKGGPCDPREAINEAQRLEQLEIERQIQAEKDEDERLDRMEATARAKLTARAIYHTQEVNPFDGFDVTPSRVTRFEKQIPRKVRIRLMQQGIDPDGMSYDQGMKLWRGMVVRWKKSACSLRQAAILRKRGLPVIVTRDEASKMLDEITRMEGWKK